MGLQHAHERGMVHQCGDTARLDELLSSGVRTAYIGFDCTADSLHVGHLLQCIPLRWWEKMGPQPHALVGGGTTQVGALRFDPLLARKHREPHVDPRDIPLVFIPWQALLWVLPVAVGIALLAFPRTALGLTFLTFLGVLGLCYEWCHYLVHSDYKPKTAAYRAVWRNHRQHHFKNEHYWFTVTSAGTADRVLGTYPDPATVATSPTAKNLHAES